ncbi:MFS transporter [Bacillus mojavensis]|jgi:FHS family glucose/mannose:H+ symporter-like MFS transporter|uniref:MFS transporter n=1 Tax=Bacillus mojavensis TaxID=72360 RepID=A0AAP3CSI4_BACMO|nr:MFS transporter [Bacillus mojavensis]MCY8103233.1 MFS transporter [Bacillus mojavensis]MCY8481599.1 MFS transporter [Bacillus mojavensis]MCY8510662.1 MFS transporter [Bacillus mojavensis]MEC1774185.1 MFS transporter [Bacillus mojavensis]
MVRGTYLFGYAFFFTVGIIHISTGSLTPFLLESFNKTTDDISIIIFFQFSGFLSGVLIAPLMIKKYSHFRTLTLALTIMLVALSIFFLTKDWYYIVVMAFLLGYGAGTLETTVGSFVIANFESNAEKMSKLEVLFGLGALSFPLFINSFIDINNWYLPYYFILTFLFVLLAGWLIFLSKNRKDAKNANQVALPDVGAFQYFIGDRKKSKQLGFFVFFAFLYAGIETNFANFLPSIMINQGNEQISLISVSFFWVGIIIGRILIGLVSRRLDFSKYLLFSCSCLIVLLIAFPYISHPILQLGGTFLIGLSIAGIFPIALTLASIIIQKYVDEVTSLFIASASFGGAIISFLIGWSLNQDTILLTMGIFTTMAVILVGISVKIRRTKTDNPISLESKASKTQ